MQYLQEVRVNDNTYITDGAAELTTAEVGTGFWLLGFDRQGTCFEMTKISRARAKECLFDYGTYSLKDCDITDFGVATYYWNEEMHDGGILKVH
jgi:hypothetical protein